MSIPLLCVVMFCYALTAFDFFKKGNIPMGWVFATYAAGVPGFMVVAHE